MIKSGKRKADSVKREMVKLLYRDAPLGEIDYIAIVDNETLRPVKVIQKNTLIALAVKFPNARLLDNTVL